MNTQKQFEELNSEIITMANKMSKWSRGNKRKAFYIYISISVLSALITLFVAIGNDIASEYSLILKTTILIFSGTTTVLAAWDGFFNHKQLWVNYGETSGLLRALELKIKLLTEDEKKDKKLFNSCYKQYQSILNNNNQKWIQLRSDEKEE